MIDINVILIKEIVPEARAPLPAEFIYKLGIKS